MHKESENKLLLKAKTLWNVIPLKYLFLQTISTTQLEFQQFQSF